MKLSAEDLTDVHRVVFETAPQPILLIDEDSSVALANAAARELPRRDALIEALHDDERASFRLELRTRGRASTELRVGEQIFAVVARTCARRIVLFVSDVTAARESEQDVTRLWGLASIGAFAASFVHDFGNLLTPLTALGDALGREISRDGMARSFVDELLRTTSSARDVVSGVRAFLRGRPSQPQQLVLNELLDGLRPLIERIVGPNISVLFALDDELAEITVDRTRFERGFLNLVANARDAMPGGGRVVIRTFSALFDGRSFAALSVTDDGAGMSDETRARALEPFFTSKEQTGTGLGLWLVRRFVRDAGGRLELRSEVGVGTQVTMYLPRAVNSDTRGASTTDPYRPRDGKGENDQGQSGRTVVM